MKIGELYNLIAKNYAATDSFQIISTSINSAFRQIQNTPLLDQDDLKIADLGVGDGRFLTMLHEVNPTAELTGLDVSPDMLKFASQRIELKPIVASIEEADKYLPHNYFDLLLATFVSSYVGIPKLLEQGNLLLKQSGYFSILTTSYESFAEVQNQVKKFKTSNNPLHRVAYYWLQKAIDDTKAPKNYQEIVQIIENSNFKICQHEQLKMNIILDNYEEGLDFASTGGWAVSVMDYKYCPVFLAKFLAKSLVRLFHYPISDHVIVESLLLQKI